MSQKNGDVALSIGIVTGNPGVIQGYLYPSKSTPASTGKGFRSLERGNKTEPDRTKGDPLQGIKGCSSPVLYQSNGTSFATFWWVFSCISGPSISLTYQEDYEEAMDEDNHPTLPHYKQKLAAYRYAAENHTIGPPEHIWYGLWNLFANDLAHDDPSLLVFPQLDFRVQTSNSTSSISDSTRYTDVALADSKTTFSKGADTVVASSETRVIMVIEVKPHFIIPQAVLQKISQKPNTILEVEMVKLIGFKMLDPQNQALEQVRYYLSRFPKKVPVEVIALATIGHHWCWAAFKKTPVTPSKDSNRSADGYVEDHQNIASVVNPWSGVFDTTDFVGGASRFAEVMDRLQSVRSGIVWSSDWARL
ncbi:unnamed protein product [Cyclocybe aegerita]|uniref:Uncharacterized protein n=1 Tax=Cyclocybe aegerita TaxID=1973307 RepID=A0A8S0VTL3_CYCAE|nr:unnamed protein product [Cyclocybe aegerita]